MSSDEGKSRGFGFVCYEDPDSAEKACDEMHAKDINGKTLFVGRAQKRNERQTELRRKFEQMKIERLNRYQGVNLYVKNLDDSIDDERLRKEFAPYGTITSAKVMTEGGRSKGKQWRHRAIVAERKSRNTPNYFLGVHLLSRSRRCVSSFSISR